MSNRSRSLAELVLEASKRTGKTLRPELRLQSSLKQRLGTRTTLSFLTSGSRRSSRSLNRGQIEMAEHNGVAYTVLLGPAKRWVWTIYPPHDRPISGVTVTKERAQIAARLAIDRWFTRNNRKKGSLRY